MSDIILPSDDDTFFDKDHIVFFSDESGDIKVKYALMDGDVFQDLVLAVLGGAISDGALAFLVKDLSEQGLQEEAMSIAVVKKLLQAEDKTPIVKPSNFR